MYRVGAAAVWTVGLVCLCIIAWLVCEIVRLLTVMVYTSGHLGMFILIMIAVLCVWVGFYMFEPWKGD